MEPSITDWIMVGITAIYVVATIAIFRANKKSARAAEKQIEQAKEQINEMKRQFDENNRPRIEVDFRLERRAFYMLRFVNTGQLTAEKVNVKLSQEFIDSLPENSLTDKDIKRILISQLSKECIIGVDQHFDLVIGRSNLRDCADLKPIDGKIIYHSYKNIYNRDFYIDLHNYVSFLSYETDEEKIIKSLQENTKALNRIQSTVERMTEKDNNNA